MAETLIALGVGASTASTIASVGQVLSVVGTVAGAASTVAGGIAESRQQKAQASVIEQQGRNEAIQRGIEAENMRRQNRVRQAAARASLAEGGSLSGTAFGFLDQNAVAQEVDALTVEYQGRLAKGTAAAQGQLLRNQAKNTRIGSFVGAGAQLLGGAGRAFADINPLDFE